MSLLLKPKRYQRSHLSAAIDKSNNELLVYRFSNGSFLMKTSALTTFQRKRRSVFSKLFAFYGSLCCCHDIRFQAIGSTCNSFGWQLLIYSSSKSLKAIRCTTQTNGVSYSSEERKLPKRQNITFVQNCKR